MNSMRSRFCSVLNIASFLGMLIVRSAAEPYIPQNPQEPLERLRSTPLDPTGRELRELRHRLAGEPKNLELAAQFVRLCLERGRAEADPRFVGRAQSALAPWWSSLTPPAEVLVLRATIKQSQHDFDDALNDLNLAVRTAPGNAQAWLTRASVLTVLARYDEARKSCVPLVGRAPELIAVTAVANIAVLTGDARRGCEMLTQTLERNRAAGRAERLWAWTLLAETSARLGRWTAAQDQFQQAFDLGQRDAYLLGAYADFLLDWGHPKEAVALLQDETRADGLLLRLALAEDKLEPRPKTLSDHVASLRARFEASHLRGDFIHQREEARFALHLLHQSGEALRLARQNWQVQREPADARILLEAGLAQRDLAAMQTVLEFIQTNHLEDVQLQRLVQQASGLAVK